MLNNSDSNGTAPKRFTSMVGWWLLLLAVFATPVPVAGQTEGDYLYRVTTLRAAPGHFNDLLGVLRESFSVTEAAGDAAPFWMRHSQGDQWDFMVIHPLGDFASYYAADRVRRRAIQWGEGSRGQALALQLGRFTAHQEEWFARSVGLEDMTRRFEGMGFFHVEMFAGLPGKRAELFAQRRMENRFYEHLSRQQNVIFIREAGTNWDAMTIGFHESLQTFAAAGVRHSSAQQDEAARRAGFESAGAIGPYLRSLLSYHHDTLAVSLP